MYAGLGRTVGTLKTHCTALDTFRTDEETLSACLNTGIEIKPTSDDVQISKCCVEPGDW